MTNRILWILAIGLLAIGFTTMVAVSANAQEVPIVLTPDAITGDFVGKVNSNVDDARLARVCLYRIDVNSPDPTAEFACLNADQGRLPTVDEVAPSGVGQIFEIPFSTVLVSGQAQVFTARNIAADPSGELMSDPADRNARIPGLLGRPMFVVPAP